MHTVLEKTSPYFFRIFIGLYFILYHFQLTNEKFDNVFNLKCQILQNIHNIYHLYLIAGPLIYPTKTYALVHLITVVITYLSWKFNPIPEYKERCMLTIWRNKMCGLPEKRGYKDIFWLFGLDNSKQVYLYLFLVLIALDLYLIFR
jgi:hypothetical protein